MGGYIVDIYVSWGIHIDHAVASGVIVERWCLQRTGLSPASQFLKDLTACGNVGMLLLFVPCTWEIPVRYLQDQFVKSSVAILPPE